MGLTGKSMGKGAIEQNPSFSAESGEKIIALAGNPNVGKSTLFNALTGLKQHTGNWAGKTVTNAVGRFSSKNGSYLLVDIPGTYSLSARSQEECVARDFLCDGRYDGVIVVCDATCLSRSLRLVLQVMELSSRVTVCVNLMDEAEKRGIRLDIERLSVLLGVPAVGVTARKKKTLLSLIGCLEQKSETASRHEYPVTYPEAIEAASENIGALLRNQGEREERLRFLSLRYLLSAQEENQKVSDLSNADCRDNEVLAVAEAERQALEQIGINREALLDSVAQARGRRADEIAEQVICRDKKGLSAADEKLDRVLTSRTFGYPIMLLCLSGILFLTIEAVNLPSAWLSSLFFSWEAWLHSTFDAWLPWWASGFLIDGCYRVLAWVVSVMLPPMAVFFPLFSLLEDAGFLPRIAYNLDRPFCACHACGKQGLTMCMGFGCNAAGVVGCRIIDSPNERMLAILTNSLVPCNGRFPLLIALISAFFVTSAGGIGAAFAAAGLLTVFILLGIGATFGMTRLLAATVLHGEREAFTLELPPYRVPQFGRVLVRSFLDRTVCVLGRAAAVAAPAGGILWISANVRIGGCSVLTHIASFLDPIGSFMGLDGVILLAFLLGFPANEIVLPIAVMIYLGNGTLTELSDWNGVHQLLVSQGWTSLTVLNTLLFSLFHWPCSTTLWTIRKETGKKRWVLLGALVPTLLGVALCLLTRLIFLLFS